MWCPCVYYYWWFLSDFAKYLLHVNSVYMLRYLLLRLRHVTVSSLQRYSACRKSNLQPWRFRFTIVAFWTLIATTTKCLRENPDRVHRRILPQNRREICSHAPVVRIIQTLGAIFKIRRKKFVEIHGRLHQAWDDYEEEKLSTTDLLRTISHINALGPSTAVHHVWRRRMNF